VTEHHAGNVRSPAEYCQKAYFARDGELELWMQKGGIHETSLVITDNGGGCKQEVDVAQRQDGNMTLRERML
jgi:hypothetical protein